MAIWILILTNLLIKSKDLINCLIFAMNCIFPVTLFEAFEIILP